MKEQSATRKKLHQIALDAPKTSGVYLWKDETGVVIYVGKAKSLKNRLSQYFLTNRDIKTRILVSHAHSIEYIQTDNEYEALLLENTLIKKHSPRYNINLKDGKTYPVIRITHEAFPKVYRTRQIRDDGSEYFGPFPNVNAIDDFLEFVKRGYHFRQCRVLKKRTTPCLYYHIGRCRAPCCGKVSEVDYKAELDELRVYLDGDVESALAKLESLMKTASTNLEFERAARLRDGIAAIRLLREQNAVVDFDPESRDYIAWAAEGTMVTFAVLQMRGGRLSGRDLYRARSLKDEEEILSEFLMAYYVDASLVPPRIFVPSEGGLTLAERWFSSGLGVDTHIEVIELPDAPAESQTGSADADHSGPATSGLAGYDPTDRAEAARPEMAAEPGESAEPRESAEPDVRRPRGFSGDPAEYRRHAAAMAMARFNAREDAARRLKEHGDFPALEELRDLLDLPNLPSRIEGFDIAHLGGRLPVASLISFKDGNPDRKNYRIFRLRTTDGVIDDFASMREVTSRRYGRLMNEGADLPDLILIDGGIGQVNAVQGVLDALGADIPIIGLAKRDEEVYLPGNSTPISLPRRSDALRLLQRVRDETHRFATTRNQKLRSKENTTLVFESLPGIGPKKAVRLLERFGSLEGLAAAFGLSASGQPASTTQTGDPVATDPVAEVAQVAGISREAAQAVAAALPALLAERLAERAKRAQSGRLGPGAGFGHLNDRTVASPSDAAERADDRPDLANLAAQAFGSEPKTAAEAAAETPADVPPGDRETQAPTGRAAQPSRKTKGGRHGSGD